MKNYTDKPQLEVKDQYTGDTVMSQDIISDRDSPVATINVSVLKRMLSHVPKIPFHEMKGDLIMAIRECETKEEIESTVTNVLDFGNIMKAIDEADAEFKTGPEEAVSEHNIRA